MPSLSVLLINSGRGAIVWDDHDDILDHRDKAHECDRPIAALLAAMVDRTDDMHRSSGWRQAAFRWQYRGPSRPNAHTKL